MDAVSHYLNHILTPRLRGYGVTEQFLLYTVSTIHTQMTSLLRHWNDREFRNTVLLLGMEEGLFYEPPAKIEIRCFVVVAIRNSPIETIQSDTYPEAGLSQILNSKDVKEITSEAIQYFSKQDFAELCSQAKLSTKRDLYLELAEEHPVAWMSLHCLAGVRGKTADYPPVQVEAPYHLDGIDDGTEGTAESGKLAVGVYDGYSPEIEPPLAGYLKMLSADSNGVLIVDSFKSVTRNVTKLMGILEFLLTRNLLFVSTNYYLENGHVERRMKLLRAGHSTSDIKRNIANTAGLAYKHKLILNRYAPKHE